jgi:hypothetical protein
MPRGLGVKQLCSHAAGWEDDHDTGNLQGDPKQKTAKRILNRLDAGAEE